MSIVRFILLILLVWILWWFGQRWYKNHLQKQQDEDDTSLPSTKSQNGTMVRCEYCGLYLPEEEAYNSHQVYYCCEKHKLANQ
jgi:uncharacterized protein